MRRKEWAPQQKGLLEDKQTNVGGVEKQAKRYVAQLQYVKQLTDWAVDNEANPQGAADTGDHDKGVHLG